MASVYWPPYNAAGGTPLGWHFHEVDLSETSIVGMHVCKKPGGPTVHKPRVDVCLCHETSKLGSSQAT